MTSGLDYIKKLDSESAAGDNSSRSETLQTVIELPSGAIAVKKQLKASEYFSMKRKMASRKESDSADSIVAATQELLMKMFEYNGQPLSIDTLEEMPIEDAATLDAFVNELFTLASSRAKS